MGDEEFAVHLNPLRRDRADFIVAAEIQDPPGPRRYEQLWVRELGEGQFELCCIPFFVYDLALEDVVETAPRGPVEHMVTRVVRRSGHHTYRAWLGDLATDAERDRAMTELQRLDAELEWYSENLAGIDVADERRAWVVVDRLQQLEDDGLLEWETGRTT